MSQRTGEEIIDSAISRFDSAGSLSAFFEEVGIAGIGMALILNIIEGIDSAMGLMIALPVAIGEGAVGLLDATFGGYVDMIEASTSTAVNSLTGGLASELGFVVPILTLIVVMISVWILMEFLARIGFNPLNIITRGADS